MAGGGYAGRRVAEGRPVARRPKGLGPDKKKNNFKPSSLKKQIRSTERMLRQVYIYFQPCPFNVHLVIIIVCFPLINTGFLLILAYF